MRSFHSLIIVVVNIVITSGLPIAPPVMHFAQQQEQPHTFHEPGFTPHHHQEHHIQFEPLPSNIREMCEVPESHSPHNPYHSLCHPALQPPNPHPHVIQNNHQMNFVQKQGHDRVRRSASLPPKQPQFFSENEVNYFRNHQQRPDDAFHEQQRYSFGSSSRPEESPFDRNPFQFIQDPSPRVAQDPRQQPCHGPGCPQNHQLPQHLHVDILSNPYPSAHPPQYNQEYQPQNIHSSSHDPRSPQFSNPMPMNQHHPKKPEDSQFKKPNAAPVRAATQQFSEIPAKVNKNMSNNNNKPDEGFIVCSGQLSSLTAGRDVPSSSCFIVVYDISDAYDTYETKLETFEQ